jgi:hypothetical protein
MKGSPVSLAAALFAVLSLADASAADRATLAKARAMYNEGRYADAIEIASLVRSNPPDASAANLVIGRSYLEQFRSMSNPADLDAAREALALVNVATLSVGDETELLIGLAETLFLEESFGAAAELFGSLLDRPVDGGLTPRERLLDWWATSIDREAQRRHSFDRAPLYAQVLERMHDELEQSPSSATAAYWIVVGARLTGALERAWDLAVASWVRAPLTRDRAAALRADLDRLVTEALIPERAHQLAGPRESATAAEALLTEWTRVKERWP